MSDLPHVIARPCLRLCPRYAAVGLPDQRLCAATRQSAGRQGVCAMGTGRTRVPKKVPSRGCHHRVTHISPSPVPLEMIGVNQQALGRTCPDIPPTPFRKPPAKHHLWHRQAYRTWVPDPCGIPVVEKRSSMSRQTRSARPRGSIRPAIDRSAPGATYCAPCPCYRR